MESLEKILTERAKELFGPVRTEELTADLAKTAAELTDVATYSVTFEDEP